VVSNRDEDADVAEGAGQAMEKMLNSGLESTQTELANFTGAGTRGFLYVYEDRGETRP
jgi:hypothetical protein